MGYLRMSEFSTTRSSSQLEASSFELGLRNRLDAREGIAQFTASATRLLRSARAREFGTQDGTQKVLTPAAGRA